MIQPPWAKGSRSPECIKSEESDIGTHHQNVTMGEVDELQDTIDHSIAESYEGIYATQCQAVHEMLEQ